MSNTEIHFILRLPVERKFLSVGEIPALTAQAIYPVDENDESDQPSKADLRRAITESDHEKLLINAIDAQEITALNPITYVAETFIPGRPGKRLLVSRGQFKEFARKLGISVRDDLPDADQDARSLYRRTEAHFSPGSDCPAELEEIAAARHSIGRYTLQEAAYSIGNEAGERPKELLVKLARDVNSGVLPAYEPGKNQKYRFGTGTVVREWYEEVFWDDLNEWLDKNEKRITFRFDEPMSLPAEKRQMAVDTGVVNNAASWKADVKKMAIEVYGDAKTRGWGSDKDSIAKALETKCADLNIVTEKGKSLKASYIARHALTPWDIPQLAEAKKQNT